MRSDASCTPTWRTTRGRTRRRTRSPTRTSPDFYDEVPGAVFCDPELATVGLRSDEAAERGLDAVTGTYPMARNGKARAMSKEDGFVRMVVERGTRRILGATLVCHDAANALQEILVAMAGDGTIAAIRKADPHAPDDRRGRQRMCARARAAAVGSRCGVAGSGAKVRESCSAWAR